MTPCRINGSIDWSHTLPINDTLSLVPLWTQLARVSVNLQKKAASSYETSVSTYDPIGRKKQDYRLHSIMHFLNSDKLHSLNVVKPMKTSP
jgi:hypothetical protein